MASFVPVRPTTTTKTSFHDDPRGGSASPSDGRATALLRPEAHRMIAGQVADWPAFVVADEYRLPPAPVVARDDDAMARTSSPIDDDYDDDDEQHPRDEQPVNDELIVSRLTAGNVALTDSRSVCEQLGFTTTAKDHGHVGGLLAGKIGKNKFVADYAIDSRSKCRYTKCCAFILQSDLRIGKIPPSIKTGHSCRTHWYHLPCIFRSFKRSCKGTKTITAVTDIDNYERLRPEDQRNIIECIRRGPENLYRRSRDDLAAGGGVSSPAPPSSLGDLASRDPQDIPTAVPPPPEKRPRLQLPPPPSADQHTEHEVQSILGLTMISRGDPTSAPLPAAPSPAIGRFVPVSQPLLATTTAAHPPPDQQQYHQMHPRQQQQSPRTVLAMDQHHFPPLWRPPGTECDLLHNDKWHCAIVIGYTTTHALIQKYAAGRDVVPIHLENEKHRVSWTRSKRASSDFA